MASTLEFVEFAVGQIRNVPAMTWRKMFGEYAVYCGGTIVALICDDTFFLKPTPGNLALLGTPVEAPAYPGSKNYYVLNEQLDDPDLMTQLIRITAQEAPKPKTKTAPEKATKATKKAPAKRAKAPAKRAKKD